MRFNLKFVKDFLEVDIPPQRLASLLTMSGMEVEHFEKRGDDWIFDIEVTSNRYDWLSIIGIAREVAACLNKKLNIKYPNLNKKPLIKERGIYIENAKDCPLYVGRVIRGVKVDCSSRLKEKVVNCGINSINNVVDITNYCMLKWGNPLHAFDEDKIEGNIYIRRAKEGESFIGIDEKERVLNRENLVISDDKKVIALAGVMGAKNTEVDSNSRNIFLEAAVFSPLTIRRSRRLAGIDTESSYRFERQVFTDYLEYASGEAAELIEELGKGSFVGYKEVGKKTPIKSKKIVISLSQLSSYLGENFPKDRIKRILLNLDFKVSNASKDKMFVFPPPFRFDVKREVDIYEEVCRIYGYEKIKPRIPFLTPQLKKVELYGFKNELRTHLAMLGLKEVITYSIEAEDDLLKLGEKNFIKILNPLRQQENSLRSNLLLGMIKAISYNLNRSRSNLRFFEIANVYSKNKEDFCEVPFLSLGINSEEDSFFYLKGIIEKILGCLNIENHAFKEESLDNFTNALMVIINHQCIGFLGRLDRKISSSFDLKGDLFFAQLEVTSLLKTRAIKAYKPFSPYPVVWRDVSIALRSDKKFSSIEGIIKEKGSSLYDYRVIDVYRGKDLPSGYSAFTLRIFYQSIGKTLTSGEVDSIHNSIRESLSKKEGIILR